MSRSVAVPVLLLALAVQATAQTTQHTVAIGISPILAFSVETEPVAMVDGTDGVLRFAYTTNLPSPRLSVSLNGGLPEGVSLRLSTSDGSSTVTVDGSAAAEFVLAGRSARHDHLVFGVTGRLGTSHVSIPVTLTLHDESTGLRRSFDRELVLESDATN